MPEFAYTARDINGQKTTGNITAGSEREAVTVLAGRSLFPISVAAQREAIRLSLGRGVNGQTMAVTYNQMSALLRSGVPLLRSISILRDQTSNKRLKSVLDQVHGRVEEGTGLGEAMARHPRVFSEMAINMVRAGGEGGFLEEALDRVAHFTEEYEDLKSRTVGALAYPVFLGVIGIGVVSVLIVGFVPKFALMFEGLRERNELPALTDWLLMFSDSIRDYGVVFLAVLAVISAFVYVRAATETGRRVIDMIKLKIPVVGGIFANLAVARFCRVLGTMLRNGVPILKSLEISRDATGNRVLSEAIRDAAENISSGQSLAAPLASSGHFPVTVVEMISVAEESNTLDKVLVEIADGLERRTSRRLDLFVRMLEPVMLLCLAVVVLLVVIALLLPVIKMSATM
ncbi:MAG TPA: type II secretion system F family protein [Pirellulaceae bacterium]|nr:type II secretion system F family protein [Pirellulaceae bacterium]